MKHKKPSLLINSPHIQGMFLFVIKEIIKYCPSQREQTLLFLISLRVLICELFLLPFWGGKYSK